MSGITLQFSVQINGQEMPMENDQDWDSIEAAVSWFRRLALGRNLSNRPEFTSRSTRMAEMRSRGMTLKQIAAHYGLTRQRVKQILDIHRADTDAEMDRVRIIADYQPTSGTDEG